MVIYFTTNEKFYAKLLRWIFLEPVSHVGMCLYPTGVTPIVIDCTKPFGKIYAYNAWTKKHSPIFAAQIPMSLEDEIKCFDTVALRSVLRPYDFSAYFHGFYHGIKWRLFGTKLPKRNTKSDHEKDLCTEIFNPIKQLLQKYGIDRYGVDLAAMTPHMLAREIYRQTVGNENVTWIGERLDTLSL